MIIGDAIAVGKRPTEHCQTFKVQAVSLKREKIRKKGKKKRQKKKKKKERKKDQPSVAKVAKCKLSAQTESPALTKPELKRGKPELKGENRIFREERGRGVGLPGSGTGWKKAERYKARGLVGACARYTGWGQADALDCNYLNLTSRHRDKQSESTQTHRWCTNT